MTSIKASSLEMRILNTVRDEYPITKDELRKRLKVSEKKLDLALKRLEMQGFIEYDVLPDTVFIRLRVVPQGKRKKVEDGTDDYSYM